MIRSVSQNQMGNLEFMGLGMFDSISELSKLLGPDILDIISREGSSSMSEGFLQFIRVF